MFAKPAANLIALEAFFKPKKRKTKGPPARPASSRTASKSRVRGLPKSAGEWPVATLVDEITTPGEGQIRALVTVAGNIVLSTPNGRQLDEALAQLDFMVSIDFYLNETPAMRILSCPPPGRWSETTLTSCSRSSRFETPPSMPRRCNSKRMVNGKPRCTAHIHPEDATALGVSTGELVQVMSRVGSIELPAEVSEDVHRGTICISHGWGHSREGTQLGVAEAHSGTNGNDIMDDRAIDPVIGTSVLNGVPVRIAPARA